ncbi:MAG: hypothetical protein HUU22_19450, partial [Phycisphaerae bacterium]|nr:hypothetical protein [Phycisphaerae bacterium]
MAQNRRKQRPDRPTPAPRAEPASTPTSAVVLTDRRTARLFALAQFAAAAVIFRVAGFYRVMDADEGHFLSAIRCVFNGLRPQQDFFFQQTPLFPYPYALAMKLFGYGYDTCLWISVLCGAGLAVVTASYFARRCGAARVGWIGWALVVTNAPILFWTPTVKNHAMPLFFGALALWAAAHRPRGGRDAFWWGALSGFAALWSAGTRLPAAPLAAAPFAWLLLRAVVPSRPPGAWHGVLGFAVGCMPPALLVLRSVFPDPWVFHFDILGFHAIRSGRAGTFGTWATISKQLAALGSQVQFPAMLLLAVFSAICMKRIARLAGRIGPDTTDESRGRPREEKPAPRPGIARLPAGYGIELGLALAGIIAGLIALLPAQTFHQYFMVPLL